MMYICWPKLETLRENLKDKITILHHYGLFYCLNTFEKECEYVRNNFHTLRQKAIDADYGGYIESLQTYIKTR